MLQKPRPVYIVRHLNEKAFLLTKYLLVSFDNRIEIICVVLMKYAQTIILESYRQTVERKRKNFHSTLLCLVTRCNSVSQG